jgi:hypothetical protein
VKAVPESANVADAWIKYHYLSGREKEKSPHFSAWQRLNDLVRDDPEKAWRIVQEIWSLDQTELILANVAAGPVEDLLRLHGTEFIARVEQLARRDPVLKKLLGAVWSSDIARDVWDRVKAVAGPSF